MMSLTPGWGPVAAGECASTVSVFHRAPLVLGEEALFRAVVEREGLAVEHLWDQAYAAGELADLPCGQTRTGRKCRGCDAVDKGVVVESDHQRGTHTAG